MAGSLEGGDIDLIASGLPSAEDLLDSADDAPAIRLINAIIAEAVRQGVSDIHIEPYESGLVVRMRTEDRKSVVEGKGVSVRVDFGGSRSLKKKNSTVSRRHTQE